MLDLPISPSDLLVQVIRPAWLYLPAKMRSRDAEVEAGAIAAQESGLKARAQAGGGPARGLWQFERGGGVTGVLTHPATKDLAASVCQQIGVEPEPQEVWVTLQTSDILAAVFARLLLWTDAGSMPTIGSTQAGWDLYKRVWRPGKPRPADWPANYDAAQAAVEGAS